MPTFEYVDPATIRILDSTEADKQLLQKTLSYEDPEVRRELQQLRNPKNASRYAARYGDRALSDHLRDLRSRFIISLVKVDPETGEMTTLSGFAARLQSMGYVALNSVVVDADPLPHPRKRPIVFERRYYQCEATEALIKVRHGAVSLATGSGKATIVEDLVHVLGDKTIVMAPSKSIAGQLYRQLKHAFGEKVGFFGDGKKQSDRQIVVAIAASLTKVEPGDKHYANLRKAKVAIFDESHLTPANTFAKVCLNLLKDAPWRFFLSATQFRNDGADLLLEGITGPVVYEKTLKQLVDEGFLAKPKFFYKTTPSPSDYVGRDWHRMVDTHFYSNTRLAAEVADLVNRIRDTIKHPVLILIDEVRQFRFLQARLKHEVGFAHGPLNADNREDVPPDYRESDVDALVEKFNDGSLPILVGTSCITTGTDIRPTGTLIYLQAGASEIKFWQAVGRGTRLVPGKTGFNFIMPRIEIPGLNDRANMFLRHQKTIWAAAKDFPRAELKF